MDNTSNFACESSIVQDALCGRCLSSVNMGNDSNVPGVFDGYFRLVCYNHQYIEWEKKCHLYVRNLSLKQLAQSPEYRSLVYLHRMKLPPPPNYHVNCTSDLTWPAVIVGTEKQVQTLLSH